MKFTQNLFVLFSLLNFSPNVYKLGVETMINTSSSPYDYDLVNVNVDLRLLYGDTNNDKEISQYEYDNFNFNSLIKDPDETINVYDDFNLLTFKPVKNDIYFYFYSNLNLNDCSLQVTYSNSQLLNSDSNLGYIENNNLSDLIYLNKFNVENYTFYKYKLDDFVNNYDENEQYRIRIYEFILISEERKVYDYTFQEPEMWYKGDDFLEDHYYYFKNNVYYYKAKLGTALGVLSTEDYYPTIFSFFRSNVASDSYVNEAQEITYLFVDFEDKLDIKDLVSVDVEYYKLQYDYIRYCPFITETDGFFNIENIKNNYFSDIYSGLYESKEFGNLENGISLNGNSTSLVSYNKDVSIFNNDGTNVTKNLNYDEYEALSDNSEEEKLVTSNEGNWWYYNTNLNNLYNSFTNVSILNNGNPYHKTISSDYDKSEYHYEQVNNSNAYWNHAPYIRSYDFKPIINLSNYESDLVGDEYLLSRQFFKDSIENLKGNDFNPEFAILIDGANSDENSTRYIRTDIEQDKIDIAWNFKTPVQEGERIDDVYSLQKLTTTCHEIYNAQLLRATVRQNNGEEITFNCLGEPSYSKYISFVGYSAPFLYQYIINDVGNFIDQLGVWAYIIGIILVILLFVILSPILVQFIKLLWKVISFPFKAIYKAIKKSNNIKKQKKNKE